MGFVVGVDLGGTATKLALFDKTGKVLNIGQVETRTADGGEHILADISSEVRSLLTREGIALQQLQGIGVGVPGPVMDGRTVIRCINLGWAQTDVASFLEQELGCECRIGNDANVAALGEAWKGASRGTHSSVMITLGTGVGGGVIINDKIIAGFRGGGGEVGHFPIHPGAEGRLCGCGNAHCLEAFASANGVAASYLSATGQHLSCREVFDAAKSGEGKALAVVDEMQHLLGRALAYLASALDPEVFVVGGGVSKAGHFLVEGIQKYYDKYVFPPIKGAKILLAELGNEAGVYGAAKLALGD